MNLDDFVSSLSTFGRRSRAVVPNDSADLPGAPVKAVVVVEAGDLSLIPEHNADNDPVIFTAVPAGFVPPFIVRRVRATGTTAAIRTIED